ncbi:MAG TPA: NAD(P)H-dependent oxidoreductase, partial [Burkholderiales bacterium]
MKPFDILLLECSPRTDATSARLARQLLSTLQERIGGAIRLTKCADLLLIASPVHNFTVPASLKTWIDY